MTNRSFVHVEDFLADSTFQQYCAGENALCVQYWEKYVLTHPEQQQTIAEARRLYAILSGHKKPVNKQLENLQENIRTHRYIGLKIAAAITLVLGAVLLLWIIQKDSHNPQRHFATQYTSKDGERKRITLPDGTQILLNARSSLSVDSQFNQKKRQVYLVGEAYFDVTHLENQPFIVHTADFDINVLGTSFNVKVYPDEPTSEAVLIKGLIVMESKGKQKNSITLKPNQKVTIYKNKPKSAITSPAQKRQPAQEITIHEVVEAPVEAIPEVAWTQNRLEIMDQSFEDLRNTLERWYGVQITFADPTVEKYRFTATFYEESIEEVLLALQKAQPFHYEINGQQIIISK